VVSLGASAKADYKSKSIGPEDNHPSTITKCMVEGRLFRNVLDVQNDNGWWSLWRGIKVIAVKR
jgi:hypothetical protein